MRKADWNNLHVKADASYGPGRKAFGGKNGQDWLGRDNRFRMNTPSTIGINWLWRLDPQVLNRELAEEIQTTFRHYGRMSWKTK